MIVEDEEDLCDLYAGWLADEYDVRVAYRGRDALDTVDEGVDVVLLDRRMPDLSGSEVLSAIRDRGLQCRVAMVTAVDPDVDIIEMGFDDYVTKPISSEQLREVVDSLLARRQYDRKFQEWFSLESKRRVLEAEKSDAELATYDEYAELVQRIDELRSELDERVRAFDGEDFQASFLTLGGADSPEGRASAERNEQNEGSESESDRTSTDGS